MITDKFFTANKAEADNGDIPSACEMRYTSVLFAFFMKIINQIYML